MKVKEFLADPRRRVIVATIAASALLLILIVVFIVNLVSSRAGTSLANESSDVAISNPVEVIDDGLGASVSASDKNTAPVDNSEEAGIVTIIPADDSASTSSTNSVSADSLPKTGPGSILPLALVLGASIAFAGSRRKSVL